MSKSISILALFWILFMELTATFAQDSDRYFRIRIIDQQTNRGVPLVELKTNNKITFYTDNNGIIVFYEPDLMNQEVYFHIKSHGYEYPADYFGYRGIALNPKSGDSALIKIKRINVAERLYRITGEGRYHHSQLVDYPLPVKQPLLKGKVMGQDSFLETFFNGKIYWLWGDSDRPAYPLGNFATSGATSLPPWKGGLDPDIGVELNYFVNDKGFSKKMCPIQGPDPVWMAWLTTLKDKSGTEKLVGSYTRVKNLVENLEQGLVMFNETTELFEPLIRFELDSPLFPGGHPFKAMVNGQEYIFFSFSTQYSLRVIADLEHVTDMTTYEVFTCLTEGSHFDTTDIKIERRANGQPVYGWKNNTEPLNAKKEKFLLEKGELTENEVRFSMHDIQTGDPIVSKSGSVFWNDFRNKWIMILQQLYGTSHLGEIWYAEGDTPTGPWVYARKIVTHDNYTFYNVGQHPIFDQENGRLIYFEGTYTNSFSGNPVQTPRYNYNQIMYRLDLNDSLLYLPAPVYRFKNRRNWAYMQREMIDSIDAWELIEDIPFFAIPHDRKFNGLLPVYAETEADKTRLRGKASKDHKIEEHPVFYGFPELAGDTLDETWDGLVGNDLKSQILDMNKSSMLVPLYEFKQSDGTYIYAVDSEIEGMKRTENPVCRVWKNPSSILTLDWKVKPIKPMHYQRE